MAFDDTEDQGQEQAIDTSGDESGAAPVVSSQPDDSGAAPVAEPQPQEAQAPPQRFGPLGRIVSYLMGEGADHPQVLAQAGQQVDPSGQMSQSDRNLLAVEQANQRGGPEAAWKLVQANRVAYNAKQAFAYAALNGNQQKPPDVHAAVDAANQAADHVLDGSNVRFMVSTGGQITATVKSPGAPQPQVFDLSPDQFRQYLNVGGAGQFDKQMQQGGIGRTLTNLSQNQQRVSSASNLPPLKGARPQAQAAPDQGQEQNQEPAPRLGGKVNGFGPSIDPDSDYSPELQRRANRMFPPGAASNHDREAWMAQQLDTENQLQNKVDVAKETGENRVKAARETGASRVQTQESKNVGGLAVQAEKSKAWQYASDKKLAAAQITADQKAAQAGSKEAQARIETARKAIATKRMTAGELSPEDKALEAQLTQSGQQANQRPAQQQQAPQRQGQAPQQPPVPGAKLYKGQWYTRGPNGEAVPYQQ